MQPAHPPEKRNGEECTKRSYLWLRLVSRAQLVESVGAEDGNTGHEEAGDPHACHEAIPCHEHREHGDYEIDERKYARKVHGGGRQVMR